MQGHKVWEWDGSLISCALGNRGRVSSETTAYWYNEPNMNQSQTAKFYTKQFEQ